VCQRHNRAIKDLGLVSAFLRIGHSSQLKVFSGDGLLLVLIFFSLPRNRGHFYHVTIKRLTASITSAERSVCAL